MFLVHFGLSLYYICIITSTIFSEYFQCDKKKIGLKHGNNYVDGKTYSKFMNIDKSTTQHGQPSNDTTSGILKI